jgi:hypothetical protein
MSTAFAHDLIRPIVNIPVVPEVIMLEIMSGPQRIDEPCCVIIANANQGDHSIDDALDKYLRLGRVCELV